MKTGKLRWHYQVIRHDIWEADIAISPVLRRTGRWAFSKSDRGHARRRLPLHARSRNGKPLTKSRTAGRKDKLQRTASTQPFPADAESALPPCDAWKKESMPRGFDLRCDYYTPASVEKANLLTPTFGMRVAPMAYSPDRDRTPLATPRSAGCGATRIRGSSATRLISVFRDSQSRPWRAGGHRQPDEQGGVEEEFRRAAEWRDDDPGGLMFQSAPDGNVRPTTPGPATCSGSSDWRSRWTAVVIRD